MSNTIVKMMLEYKIEEIINTLLQAKTLDQKVSILMDAKHEIIEGIPFKIVVERNGYEIERLSCIGADETAEQRDRLVRKYKGDSQVFIRIYRIKTWIETITEKKN